MSTNPAFQNFVHLSLEEAELLGAPLSTGSAMNTALSRRCDDLARAATRLGSIAAHDALVLLKASFSAPKLMHTLRASPCCGHPVLERFDDLLRECVGSITNNDLTEVQWIQASLPVRSGGLGHRRVSSLASSAFLALAASTRDLQETILLRCEATADQAVDHVLDRWTLTLGQSDVSHPVSPSATKQRDWDKYHIGAELARLRSSMPDAHNQACLLAVTAPQSGD